MFRVFCFSMLLLLTAQANADLVWRNNLSIKTVEYAWNGSREVLIVFFNENPATGCAVSDTKRLIGYIQGAIDKPFEIRYAGLLAAMTANKKVDVLVERAICDPVYGTRLEGVRIHN